jgi:rsbT co-antagonist protein RsbR
MTTAIDTSRFFTASSTPMAILSPDGIVAELNGGWERLCDEASGAKGKPFVDLLRPSDVGRVTKLIAELGRDATSFAAGVRTKESRGRWVRFDASRDEHGNVLLVGSVDDTAREDDALRLTILDTVLESAPVILWSLDAEGRYTTSEGRGLEALGSSPGAWVGQNALEDWKGTPAHANLSRALAGETYSDRLHLEPASYDVWYLPIKDENGRPNGMLGFALDVTTQMRAEKELREKLSVIEKQNATLELLSRTLQSASLILWRVDRDGVIAHAEGKGLERVGLSSDAIIGMSVFDAYKDAPDVLTPISKALAGEETRAVSVVGNVHFDAWYMPVRSHDGQADGCIGLSLDISERMKTELELREKLELIERQSATIRALATPIIQIWDDILCLPVIGTVDSARTVDMMDSLLGAIVREKARYTIVDLTGAEVVDTSTADHLIQLFRAAKTLGVESVVCGIRPAVAQTVVALGLDLGSVRTTRSLRDALMWCMRNMREADEA